MLLTRDEFLNKALHDDSSLDRALLAEAFDFASTVHKAQKRASGEPFLVHPLAVALSVAELRQGTEAVVAALLHDCLEDTQVEVNFLEKKFGAAIAKLVSGMTKLSSLELPQREARQAEYFRRLLLTLAEDVRVIVIKLIDRLHNMETLSFLEPERRRHVASETLEIYAPLAHRLGMGTFRAQLEDLSFKQLDPASYQQIKERVAARKEERTRVVDDLTSRLGEILHSDGVEASITGRIKHFYAIYKKLRRSSRPFNEIWDLIGLRVITTTVSECYAILGLVHANWLPVENRFKDYVARPKSNMYQSLHTTVLAPGDRPVELQIRTIEMHSIAEYGVAAHWRYHLEQTGGHYSLGEHLVWFRELMDAGKRAETPQDLLRLFREGPLRTETVVLTPKGELVPLRSGSTALDFAFALHTELGLHCSGARVDGKAVQLGHVLRSGDQMEILTSPTAHPTSDWLARVSTSSAKQKIRRYLHQSERERQQSRGRTSVLRELRRVGHPLPRTQTDWEALCESMGYPTPGELFLAAGTGRISARQLGHLVQEDQKEQEPGLPDSDQLLWKTRRTTRGIRLGGLQGIAVRYAACCNPIPGDEVVALVTRGRGASVHRATCRNALRGDPSRWFRVEWDVAEGDRFVSRLTIRGARRRGLLGELEPSVQNAGSELRGMEVQTGPDYFEIKLEVCVTDTAHLGDVRAALGRIPGVRSVARGLTGSGPGS